MSSVYLKFLISFPFTTMPSLISHRASLNTSTSSKNMLNHIRDYSPASHLVWWSRFVIILVSLLSISDACEISISLLWRDLWNAFSKSLEHIYRSYIAAPFRKSLQAKSASLVPNPFRNPNRLFSTLCSSLPFERSFYA